MVSTTEIYEAAIAKLQNYVNEEPDQEKRDVATKQIRQLRIAIQEARFDDFCQRTSRLTELKEALEIIVNNGSDGSGASGAIAELDEYVKTIIP